MFNEILERELPQIHISAFKQKYAQLLLDDPKEFSKVWVGEVAMNLLNEVNLVNDDNEVVITCPAINEPFVSRLSGEIGRQIGLYERVLKTNPRRAHNDMIDVLQKELTLDSEANATTTWAEVLIKAGFEIDLPEVEQQPKEEDDKRDVEVDYDDW